LGFLGQINIVKITTAIQKGAINFMRKQNRRTLLGWQDRFQCVSAETPLLLSNHINNAPLRLQSLSQFIPRGIRWVAVGEVGGHENKGAALKLLIFVLLQLVFQNTSDVKNTPDY